MLGFTHRRDQARRTVRATVASGLVGVLLAGAVIAPQSADAYALSPIDGSYLFNANGWTGTLTVARAENLDPSIVMSYDELGTSEYLSGTWSPTTGTLTIFRPLSNGVSQSYYLYLGNHVAGSPVFGGYFTETDQPGLGYGAFADDFVPQGAVRPSVLRHSSSTQTAGSATSQPNVATKFSPIHPLDLEWSDLDGAYDFNGNGWTGRMLMNEEDCPSSYPEGVSLYYDAIGTWEYTPGALLDRFTNTVTIQRPLSDGAVQTYVLYLGTHVSPAVAADAYHPVSVMLGGYFTESDTGSTRYAAFATYSPPGLGC